MHLSNALTPVNIHLELWSLARHATDRRKGAFGDLWMLSEKVAWPVDGAAPILLLIIDIRPRARRTVSINVQQLVISIVSFRTQCFPKRH